MKILIASPLLLDVSRMTKLPLHSNHVKRRSPDHDRLCPVEVIRLQSKDFFKDRFSQSAVIIPSTFKTVKCLNITVPSHLAKGGHCLNIMDCQETKTRKYFMVFDPAKRETNGCLRGRIAQINSVPVECSCLWPRYLGNNPSLFLHRQH